MLNHSPYLLLVSAFLLSGCSLLTQESKQPKAPSGYDFSKPVTTKLPEELDEISGITYHTNGASLWAINDEEGRLYTLSTSGEILGKARKFAKGADFEDICRLNGRLYVLKSNGDVSVMQFNAGDSIQLDKIPFPSKGGFDFETLFELPGKNQLVILCKSCPNQVAGQVPGYILDIATNKINPVPEFKLDFSALQDSFPQPKKSLIRPSAAAFHPITGKLFVLASANRLLMVCDADGVVRETYSLSKKTFKQPEGICFAPDAGLYISNEAVAGIANIQYFTFQNPSAVPH